MDVEVPEIEGGRVDPEQFREELGRIVREEYVRVCHEAGDTKPSHLAPWEELSEYDKEVDRRIGVAVALVWEIHRSHG